MPAAEPIRARNASILTTVHTAAPNTAAPPICKNTKKYFIRPKFSYIKLYEFTRTKFKKNFEIEAGASLRMVAPRAGFRGGTLFRTKNK